MPSCISATVPSTSARATREVYGELARETSAENAVVPDYYAASSYIIPTSSLVIAPQPSEGYYDVRFEVCTVAYLY